MCLYCYVIHCVYNIYSSNPKPTEYGTHSYLGVGRAIRYKLQQSPLILYELAEDSPAGSKHIADYVNSFYSYLFYVLSWILIEGKTVVLLLLPLSLICVKCDCDGDRSVHRLESKKRYMAGRYEDLTKFRRLIFKTIQVIWF